MKYGPDIIRRVTEELKKVPTVRQACNKLGIDHSTFYRWMAKHFEFHQEVEAALLIGRSRMNDAAEGVIMTGIQNGDMRAAVYWLSHNNERYVDADQARYFQYVQNQALAFLREKTPPDSIFEVLFNLYFEMELNVGIEFADMRMKPLIEYTCHIDANLMAIFYASYAEWKTNKLEIEEKRVAARLPSEAEIAEIEQKEKEQEEQEAEL